VEMDREFRAKLNSEIKLIERFIPNIHRGGCGVFALLMWDTLAFMGMITNPIELFDGYPIWERNHILLKYGNLYIDSMGIHETTHWMELDVERPIKLEELRPKAWDEQIWFKGDECFDRGNIVPMKKMIHRLGYNLDKFKREKQILSL